MRQCRRFYPFGCAVKRTVIFLVAMTTLLMLPRFANANGINNALNNAKKEGRAVMLELGSVGCRPCEEMKPVMEELRANYREKLDVIFVDIRKDSDTGRRFRVFLIPVQVFLDRNGKEFHRHVGYYSYEEIVSVLKKAGI